MKTVMEWRPVTTEEFPFAQADVIRQINEEKERNLCVVLEITDGTDVHCFVAVNGPEIDMPQVTPEDKNVVWHYTKAPDSLVFRNTYFSRDFSIASGTRRVKLVNCHFAEGRVMLIDPGVREVDIDKNQGPVRIRVLAK